jgi:single-stranded DNA-binding protein
LTVAPNALLGYLSKLSPSGNSYCRPSQVVSFGDTGNKVVKFSVAVKEFSSNTDEEKTLWLDVDAWNGLGERALKTITKGREVVVHGRLALSTYTKEEDGVKKQITKPVVKLTSFHLCGKKPTSQGET